MLISYSQIILIELKFWLIVHILHLVLGSQTFPYEPSPSPSPHLPSEKYIRTNSVCGDVPGGDAMRGCERRSVPGEILQCSVTLKISESQQRNIVRTVWASTNTERHLISVLQLSNVNRTRLINICPDISPPNLLRNVFPSKILVSSDLVGGGVTRSNLTNT